MKSKIHSNALLVMLVFTAFFLKIPAKAQTGSITVTSVAQRTNGSGLVDIYFNLSGPGSSYNIAVEASFNAGSTYTAVPANYLSGNVNNISPGSNKHIVWDGLGSFPNTYSTQSKLKVIANPSGSGMGQPCPDTPSVTDIDGNTYNTVLIGNQCWMKENLKTTKYRNGTNIAYPGSNNTAWGSNNFGAYAWNDNDISWKNLYGALYNWHAVNNSNSLCPTGWHVPSDTEWTQLTNYAFSQGYPNSNDPNGAGNALKSCRQVNSPLGDACNTTLHPRWEEGWYSHYGFDAFGFSALPGGIRFSVFHYFGYYGYWWSSTNEWDRKIDFNYGDVNRRNNDDLGNGLSVRCIKDTSPSQEPINTLDCNSATNSGILTQGTPASEISITIPYTGGNGSSHNGQTITSTGVTGLMATLAAGSFAIGNGTLTYTITGTPVSSGAASFALNIGGKSCLLGLTVNTTGGGTGQPCPGTPTVTDIDGNTYNTVLVGNQCWMKENLKTTKYRNGTNIIYPGNNDIAWQNNTTGAYTWYENDISWKNLYGALYNWHAVNNSNSLCPPGWHVPSNDEWTQLTNYVVSLGYPNNEFMAPNGAGNALKSCRQLNSPLGGDCNTTLHPRWDEDGWNYHYGFDAFGFSALPGGLRETSNFEGLGHYSHWWSSTEQSLETARMFYIAIGNGSLYNNHLTKSLGFNVRCLKDETVGVVVPTVSTTQITIITQNGATSGGNVTNDGGASVTARGVCWNTSQNPTITNSHTSDGSGIGVFTSNLTGLAANTTYFVRAYATNSAGTAYGNQLQFRNSQITYPKITLNSSSINIGQNITIIGSDFKPNGTATITLQGPAGFSDVVNTTTSSVGAFTKIYTTTTVMPVGNYTVSAKDNISALTTTMKSFTLNAAAANSFLVLVYPSSSFAIDANVNTMLEFKDKMVLGTGYPISGSERLYSYNIQLSANGGVTWGTPTTLTGQELINQFIFKHYYYSIPTPGTNYQFKITDNYRPSNSITSPIFTVNSATSTGNLKVQLKWDYSYPTTGGPVNGICADGTARIYLDLAKINPGVGSPISSVMVSLNDGGVNNGIDKLGKVKVAINTTSYSIEANGANTLTATNNTPNLADYYFWYVAPNDFVGNDPNDASSSSRKVNAKFTVTYANATVEIIEIPIIIVRPPLMLVHGLGGDPSTWSDFRENLFGNTWNFTNNFKFKTAIPIRIDPSANFVVNALTIVRGNIDDLENSMPGVIRQMRLKGYASVKVDYIGHSMGGSVLRNVLDRFPNIYTRTGNYSSLPYKNYESGYVNKVITLGTPHKGSPLANIIDRYVGGIPKWASLTLQSWYGFADKPFPFYFIKPVNPNAWIWDYEPTNAVMDLRVNNGVSFNASNVKAHLIAGDILPGEQLNLTGGLIPQNIIDAVHNSPGNYIEQFVNYLFQVAKSRETDPILLQAVQNAITNAGPVADALSFIENLTIVFDAFNYGTFVPESDLVVNVGSQLAGFSRNTAPNVTVIDNFVAHSSPIPNRETNNLQIGNAVMQLLNDPISSNKFSGFPDNSNKRDGYQFQPLSKANTFFSIRDTTMLKLVQPIDSSSFMLDASLNVGVMLFDTLGLKTLNVYFQGKTYPINNFDLSEIIISIQVNSNQLNWCKLVLEGYYNYSDSAKLVYDERTVDIFTNETVIGFTAEPELIQLAINQISFSNYTAYFANFNTPIAANDPYISLIVNDTNVVAIDNASKGFLGKQLGQTFAVATYLGISDTIYFNVSGCIGGTVDILSAATYICTGDTLTLTADNGIHFEWSTGDTTQSINVTKGENYSVFAIDSNGCLATESVNIIENPLPETPTITLTGNILTSDATNGNQWYNQNGLINGATNQDYTVTTDGNYFVKVTLLGCSSEPSNVIIMTGLPTVILFPNILNFNDVIVGQFSVKSYHLIASNLTSDVVVTAPYGYLVSLTPPTDFYSSLNLPPTGGSISLTIYVKFYPELQQSYPGIISNTSGSVVQNVTVSGTGISQDCQPPLTWTINPADFQYSCQITARVKDQDGNFVTSGTLAVFVNDVCRGLITATTFPEIGYIFPLMCHSNVVSGEILSFKYFNPSTCNVCNLFNLGDPITFVSDLSIGNAFDPKILSCSPPEVTVTKPLFQGNTYFSLNVTTTDMSINNVLSSLAPIDLDNIKNQFAAATYYTGIGWWGPNLASFNPASMYHIKLASADQLTFTGTPVNVSTTPLQLNSGWNWIAYYPQAAMSIYQALNGLNWVQGDNIKNNTSFSTYYSGGTGWWGNLTVLEPLDGYKLKITNAQSFTYPTGKQNYPTNEPQKIAAFENKSGFTTNPYLYSHSGALNATVYDGETLINTQDGVLLAFVGDECRGAAFPLMFNPTGTYTYQLMVYSNVFEGEMLEFKFYDEQSGVLSECIETIEFSADMLLADAFNPINLHLKLLTDNQELQKPKSSLQLRPNPFDDMTTVSFFVAGQIGVRIEVTDVFGRLIKVLTDQLYSPGQYAIEWHRDSVAAGSYYVKMITGKNEILIKKAFIFK